MNKPAHKEPSMDEILSSIRQIIADDDAAGAPRRPSAQSAPPPMQAAPAKPLGDQDDRDLSDMLDDIEPLALSPSQIIEEGEDADGFSFDSILADTESAETEAPRLVEAEDVTFDAKTTCPALSRRPRVSCRPIRRPPPPSLRRSPQSSLSRNRSRSRSRLLILSLRLRRSQSPSSKSLLPRLSPCRIRL